MRFFIVFLAAAALTVAALREKPEPVDVYIGIIRTMPPAKKQVEVKKTARLAPQKKQPPTARPAVSGRKSLDPRAAAIDRFFAERDAPLDGYGPTFVRAADAYGLDWRLLPAIAWKESLGGKSRIAQTHRNPFGVGDPRFWRFADFEHAIYRTARMIGGDSRHYREDMRPSQILRTFNKVEWAYPSRVMRIMAEVHKS